MRFAVLSVGGAFLARYGGQSTDARRSGKSSSASSNDSADGEWMQRARKLANQRAAQFRKERGAQPVAPAQWRRKRKGEKGNESDNVNFREAARGYDDLPGRRVDPANDEPEMTATAGDGLWRVDMDNLSEEDWQSQWTMANEEWNVVKKDVKKNAPGPMEALMGFEDSGLRRVSPEIAAGMLKIVADKAKANRTDREEMTGIRRDSRVAHLIGTCVAAARRGSDALSPKSVSNAAWALAVIAGERSNSAEMEVLSDRASQMIDSMSPRQTADLAWALASCRHASTPVFQALDIRFASDLGLQKYSPFDLSTLAWAFAHLGNDGSGFVDGLNTWFTGGAVVEETVEDDDVRAALTATASKKAQSFTPQTLVATAWGLTVMGGDALGSFSFKQTWTEIGRKGVEYSDDSSDSSDDSHSSQPVKLGAWGGKHLNQIHQVIVSVDALGGAGKLGLPELPKELVAAADNAWAAQRRPPVTSWYQRDVASILAYMGEKHEEEAFCAGYRVDLLVLEWTGTSSAVAVEVDGPSHFARNDHSVKLGQTKLKHRQLAALGYTVVSVPVADWEYLETSEEKVEYLRGGFEEASKA